jgi:excisionase family DNA binding protein
MVGEAAGQGDAPTTQGAASMADVHDEAIESAPLALRLVYTPREAGRLLSVSRSRVFELIASGELSSFLHGRKRLLRHEALVAYVDRIEAEARAREAS